MEFVKTFGLNPQLLLAQVVNFLILLYLLNRFVYKPVLKLLGEREERIKKGVADAQKSEELLEEARLKEQKILQDAQLLAQEIVKRAREDIEHSKQAFEEKMKRDREQMLLEAKQDIVHERAIMEKELMHKVSTIAIAMVEKVLRFSLGLQDRKQIANRAVKELRKHHIS